MPDTGWLAPSALSITQIGTGASWSNVSNMAYEDNNSASVDLAGNGFFNVSNTLDWDWIEPSYPTSAYVVGIECQIWVEHNNIDYSPNVQSLVVFGTSLSAFESIVYNLFGPYPNSSIVFGGPTEIGGLDPNTLLSDLFDDQLNYFQVRQDDIDETGSTKIRTAFARVKLYYEEPTFVDMESNISLSVTVDADPLYGVKDLATSLSAATTLTGGIELDGDLASDFDIGVILDAEISAQDHIDMSSSFAFSTDLDVTDFIRNRNMEADLEFNALMSAYLADATGFDPTTMNFGVTAEPTLYKLIELQTDPATPWFSVTLDVPGFFGAMEMTTVINFGLTMDGDLTTDWALYASLPFNLAFVPYIDRSTNLETNMQIGVTLDPPGLTSDQNIAASINFGVTLEPPNLNKLPVPGLPENTFIVPAPGRTLIVPAPGRTYIVPGQQRS